LTTALHHPQLTQAAQEIAAAARSLFDRGYSYGTAGNISVRIGDRVLVTPTGSSFGSLNPEQMALTDMSGQVRGSNRPSKELPFHLAAYAARPDIAAVVHLHSTHAVALSCVRDLDLRNALPPLTPYFVMKCGNLPVVPYHRPGSPALAAEVMRLAPAHDALLMANHGSIVLGKSLYEAASTAEELEEQCKIYFLLQGRGRPLSAADIAELNAAFRS
jgi:ribulose-5-phosphate 4-epimerase/fuculose-1-phosphate aldolase